LLRHLGRDGDAARIEAAVEADLASRGEAKIVTSEVGDRIAAAL
ncbi:MAG: 3-isopropylmalate dehydrogenase, partial [Rhodococcus sp. (in: high G+C Gram-positive bacteria)]